MEIAAIFSVVLIGYSFTLGPVRAADSCNKDAARTTKLTSRLIQRPHAGRIMTSAETIVEDNSGS